MSPSKVPQTPDQEIVIWGGGLFHQNTVILGLIPRWDTVVSGLIPPNYSDFNSAKD